jgi:two-component system, response regulator FlrC
LKAAALNETDESRDGLTLNLIQPLVGRDIADVERALILKTLELCRGNRTHAAQILGVSVRTIHNKLRLWRPSMKEAAEPAMGGAAGKEA